MADNEVCSYGEPNIHSGKWTTFFLGPMPACHFSFLFIRRNHSYSGSSIYEQLKLEGSNNTAFNQLVFSCHYLIKLRIISHMVSYID